MNFLTDDPWNPAHYAGWFHESLRQYDYIFSPRRANLRDLQDYGCQVHYLPFAYSPDVHFPDSTRDEDEDEVPDVMFAGGADRDRLPHMRALVSAGMKIALYGGYWNQHSDLKPYWRGNADPATLRRATTAAKIALCLVRRANRDGHTMRTFEVPAIGACILMEDTPEHRDIFGTDGETVTYFRSISQMIDRAHQLLMNGTERERLASAAHARITRGHHTYANRLQTMLQIAGLQPATLALG